MLALAFAIQTPVVVPIFAAYSEPVGRGEDETPLATDKSRFVVWYGEAHSRGPVALKIQTPSGDGHTITIVVNKVTKTAVAAGGVADFGSFDLESGPVRVAAHMDQVPGPTIDSLQATGDVRWNMSKRLNAASVHFRWPTEKGSDIRWFYNEAAMLTDPLWSYTMACGFARGYFGMQVNSPKERRIIFSVWDSGTESVSRDKVAEENRVQLVMKGGDVYADSFGNEGTGGHSHLALPWKTGQFVRFLVGCRPEGEKTLYAGYYMAPGDTSWRLVAAFRAPKDGGPLRDLYSFSENFGGDNGFLWRESAYGNGWIGLADGSWKPLTEAKFTTDGHGKTERWDYDAFVKDGRFHLRHGGFVSGTAKYGDVLTLPKAAKRPKFDLPTLP